MSNQKKNLFIVESPNKIKKIKSFLDSSYLVTASKGHIRNLNPKNLSIDVNDNFKPIYIVDPNKRGVVRDLKRLIKQCDLVWFATDKDREGESIAWHLAQVLKVQPEKQRRIVFTEITKKAILKSIEKPGQIDMNMFYAQQARLVLDKLIGYLLSPLLWKQFSNYHLSAGRVQSVVLRLIVEREDFINKFSSNNFFKVEGGFCLKKPKAIGSNNSNSELTSYDIWSELNTTFQSREEIDDFLEKCQSAKFTILGIRTNKTKRKPPPPFITSTLQQEASSKLGMSPKRTMKAAQKLYENGYITYMRTDSFALAKDALASISKQITDTFGQEYHKETIYKTKSKSSQEAHEACRPSKVEVTNVTGKDGMGFDENRLYQLIWRRTMACQMEPTQVEIKTIKIGMDNSEEIFVAKYEKIVFDGYLKVMSYGKTKNRNEAKSNEAKSNEADSGNTSSHFSKVLTTDLEKLISKLKKGKEVFYSQIKASEKYTKSPKARFTEASLIKTLDELGIGRPSSYAGMTTKVQDRKYVELKNKEATERDFQILTLNHLQNIDTATKTMKVGGEKNKLFPTDTGKFVLKFLMSNFDNILDYGFTASVEALLDEVASGDKVWYNVIKGVYDQFNPKILELGSTDNTKEKDKYERLLGIDPKTKREVAVYLSRNGPVIVLRNPVDKKHKYAGLGKYKMDTITLEEALSLLIYPYIIGKYNRKDIQVNDGRYGKYLKYDNKNYSLKNHSEIVPNIDTLTLEQAISVIKETDTQRSKIIIKKINEDIIIKNGRYGPYICFKGSTNVKIPKNEEPKSLTLKRCQELIDDKAKNPKGRYNKAKNNPKGKTKGKAKDNTKGKAKGKQESKTKQINLKKKSLNHIEPSDVNKVIKNDNKKDNKKVIKKKVIKKKVVKKKVKKKVVKKKDKDDTN